MIDKSNDFPSIQHENQASEIYDCRSSTRNVRQPFEKSQSYNTLHFIQVAELQHLTFYSEKVFNHYMFSRAEGQIKQIWFFNVPYVNVKLSIFDVIGCLNTT